MALEYGMTGIKEENALIESIKNGERASFDNLVRLYRQRGLGIAYNIVGNLEDAKDVLQDALIRVYLNIKSFRGASSFSTWFYRVVVNSSLDFLRRRKKADRIFTEPFKSRDGKEREAEDLGNEPAKIVIEGELSLKLEERISGLPEKQKACFILKYRNGMAPAEIAQVIKCSPATVKVHIFRAVRALREKMSPYLAR